MGVNVVKMKDDEHGLFLILLCMFSTLTPTTRVLVLPAFMFGLAPFRSSQTVSR